MIAAAGSGKTTWVVKKALEQKEGNVLITTYTISNAAEITKKIIELNKAVPEYITVQTWFSFLLQHGVRPYQGQLLAKRINGLLLVNEQSNRYAAEETSFMEHYFTPGLKIFSDKLSKFVIRSDKKSSGEVISRLSRIYTHVFVDEVQDLAGFDLEVLKLLFLSNSQVLLVGDPRQVTYLTHHEKKHSPYRNGEIKRFIKDEELKCDIDETTLKKSHRNNAAICEFSSKLYPKLPATEPCECVICRADPPAHAGIYLVREADIESYQQIYRPVTLRRQIAGVGEWTYGMSKGLGFDRVLIYPTDPIIKYLKNGKLTKIERVKDKVKVKDAFDIARFYVAITRARYSVAIVCNFKDEKYPDGIKKWNVITSTQVSLFE